MKKTINPKTTKAIIISIIGMFITGSVLGFFILRKKYQEVRTIDTSATYVVPQTPPSQELDADDQMLEVEYEFLNGWNFIAFPHKPLAFETAAGALNDIANNGGFVTTIAVWDGDRWQQFTHDGDKQYGLDFPIEPGRAYFFRSHEQYVWKVFSTKLQNEPKISLKKGWNGVGLIGAGGQNAENILDQISQGEDVAREIDWWQSGSWDVFVKRIYSPENIRSYGDNFSIDETKGYMINVTKDSILESRK